MTHDLLTLYPALAHLVPSLQSLGHAAEPISVEANTVLFDVNGSCQGFPLVLEGEIKVSRHASDGRALELYRVVPGELCLVSSASLFRSTPMSAQGVSARPTRLLVIAPSVFLQWMETADFRSAILGLFAERMSDLTELIDAVTFQRLDQRLAATLLGRGQNLALTHQQLANELGTVREMVSRLLRRFEREGWVALSREHIVILDSKALRVMADSQAN